MGVCDKKCNVDAVFYQVKQEGKEKNEVLYLL